MINRTGSRSCLWTTPARGVCDVRPSVAMRVRPAVVMLVCLAGLLSGCIGGDPEQASTKLPPTEATTPSTAPPPTTTAPPNNLSAAKAITLAQQTSRAINILYVKQDPRPLQAIGRYCRQCTIYINAIMKRKAQGYHFSGGQTTHSATPHFSGVIRRPPEVFSYVEIPVVTAALHVTDAHGRPYNSDSDPAGGGSAEPRGTFTCSFDDIGGKWVVVSFGYEFRS